MNKWILLIVAAAGLALWFFAGRRHNSEISYVSISQEEAKKIMETAENYVILDVRTHEEFQTGHIPGARCLPLDEVAEKAKVFIPDQDMLYLVYCRSGRRSKEASQILAELGYTNIREFGGILDWPYEVER